MSRRGRQEITGGESQDASNVPPTKRLKPSDDERPKSKKELRAERKAAKRAAQPKTAQELKAESKRLAKERKKQQEKETLKELIKQQRQEKKMRQQRRRQVNAQSKQKNKEPKNTEDERDVALKLLQEIRHGRTDAASGMTTIQLGVQYKDVVVGKGAAVQNKSLVTVKYKLTSAKTGVEIDSSNKFNFRVGKGEVIQGWDMGLLGMRVGGRRQLVVPPKAGYGSQDIGAGPGAILHFDIALQAIHE